MLKIAICDDEKTICGQLHKMLDRHSKSAEFLITEFYTGEKLCSALLLGEYFDLIILDIEFPGLSGIEVGNFLRGLNDSMTQILYVSGTEGYERKLFDSRPLNFLPKPVNEEKLLECVDTTIALIGKSFPCFTFVDNHTAYRVPYRNIYYFRSIDKRIHIFTSDGCSDFLGRLDDLKLPEQFVRIHQSYIVNYTHVKATLYDYVVMNDDSQITISRTYRKEVRKFLLEGKY